MKINERVRFISGEHKGKTGRLIEINRNDYVIRVGTIDVTTSINNLQRLFQIGDTVRVKDVSSVPELIRKHSGKIVQAEETKNYGGFYNVNINNMRFVCKENEIELVKD